MQLRGKMSPYCRLSVCIAFSFTFAFGLSAPVEIRKPVFDAHAFLQNYGYLHRNSPEVGNMVHQSYVDDAVRKYQEFMKLPVTGILDAATQQLMESPRCGVPDIIDERTSRFKRYDLSEDRWPVRSITWSVSQMSSQLKRYYVESEVQQALKLWSDQTGLTFTKDNTEGNKRHIDIRFHDGYHGDDTPFDGPGRILAHAFFPESYRRGQVHFDDDENWRIAYGDTHFRRVAVHEFGHTLGLRHSDKPNSIMFPNYPSYRSDFEHLQLHLDDIAGIQAIYGKAYQETVSAGYPSIPATDDDKSGFKFAPAGQDKDGDPFGHESSEGVAINYGFVSADLRARNSGPETQQSTACSSSDRPFPGSIVVLITCCLALFIG